MKGAEVWSILTDTDASSPELEAPNMMSIYRSWVRQQGMAVIIFDVRNGIPYVKQTHGHIESITGYKSEQMVGQPLMSFIQQRDNSDLAESIEMVERGLLVPKNQLALRADGSLLETWGFVKKHRGEYIEFIWSSDIMKYQ
jgi:PAS domain S-box-containing protein